MQPVRAHRRCGFTRLQHVLLVFFLPLLILLGTGAGGPSWSTAPEARVATALDSPPWPEGWVVEDGLYGTVAGDPADRPVVHRVAQHLAEAVPRIAGELDIPTGRKVRVYVCHTAEQFKALQPGAVDAWADATAWPSGALIFLRAPHLRPGTAAPLTQVLDHELTHTLIDQRFHGDPVPRWLHEGLAQIMAREYSPATTKALARGTLGPGLMSLDELVRGFPEDPLRAQVAYAQSADLVAYLRNEYGQAALQTLVRRLAAGAPVRAAFRDATGEGLDEIDQAWRARLQQSHLWFPALFDDNVWWLAGGLLLFGGYLRVRSRNRRRRAWMEREETLREQMDQAWIRQLGAHPAVDPPAGTERFYGVPAPTDGWSQQPARRLAGWVTDERIAEGFDADSVEDPRSPAAPSR
ncbi:MAG: hypothetical protein ABIO70_03400 [Pseudomonadota bacterium]